MIDRSARPIQDDAVYVVGVGAQTAVGRTAPATAAAVRCGISAYAEHPFMLDARGSPMVVAHARWLAETLPSHQRISSLAIAAAHEALGPVLPRLSMFGRPASAHIALSGTNLADTKLRGRFVEEFAAGLDGRLAQAPSVVVDGHAGGLLALQEALERLRRGESHVCLVGGADSWIDPATLSALDRAQRLHSERQPWGFTPGEGAGFCTITTGAWVRRLSLRALAQIAAVATADEQNLMDSSSVCVGTGLSRAFGQILAPGDRVTQGYCDLNGETYRADELGFTIGRFAGNFEDPSHIVAPAGCWGDVGAATGPLLLTLPVAAWERGYSLGEVSVVSCSGASLALRAAARLHFSRGP